MSNTCKINTSLSRDRFGGWSANYNGHIIVGGAKNTSHPRLIALAKEKATEVFGPGLQFVTQRGVSFTTSSLFR